MQMLNTLVSIKPGESIIQAIIMWLKANTIDALAILSYANQNIFQTRKDDVMPSLIMSSGSCETIYPRILNCCLGMINTS